MKFRREEGFKRASLARREKVACDQLGMSHVTLTDRVDTPDHEAVRRLTSSFAGRSAREEWVYVTANERRRLFS